MDSKENAGSESATATKGRCHLLARGIHRFLIRPSLSSSRHAMKALAYGVTGGAVVCMVVAIMYLNGRSDLSVWHEAELKEEFTAKSKDADFSAYLKREERLFEELDKKVYAANKDAASPGRAINRFTTGSLADPRGYLRNWNRTFELTHANPAAGVLLLHGMSDSPYSLRALGEALNAEGCQVVGLRLPGHGTAPSGLLEFEWEDMHAAVCLAMRHLRKTVGERPIHLIGYSNGGALSINYALQGLDDETLPKASGVVLISPAIGVSPMASLAIWQMRIGDWLGMEKLEWNSILPEYDPYKYNSFAVNAGHQVYRLTTEIRRQFDRHSGTGSLEQMPPVLAFQSAVDATVSTPALIEGLFGRLPSKKHELVLFDVNRMAKLESLITHDPAENLASLINGSGTPFAVTVVTNRGLESAEVEIRRHRISAETGPISASNLAWPKGLYSLSHVSLPFPPDDPLYGNGENSPFGAYSLGNIALRGERGVLQVSAADQLRLRWNPFFDYVKSRVLGHVLPSPH